MIELDQIVSGLVQRTAEGKLKWTRSVQYDRYIVSVDTISVTITEEFPGRYRLEVADEAGDIVDSLGHRDANGEQMEELERLYVLARRSAYDVSSVLERLAKGLEL